MKNLTIWSSFYKITDYWNLKYCKLRITEFNQLDLVEAESRLQQCCSSEAWVSQMNESRPFDNVQQMQQVAVNIWSQLDESDYLQAFDGHPKIGDPSSLRKKYANTHQLASDEQSSVKVASDETIQDLADKNQQYLDKFGFIFIVCATGKSADEMLSLLNNRLPNDRNSEIANAADEQRKITAIRIEKLISNS